MLLREAGMARNQGDSHLGVFAFFVKEGEGLNQEPGGGGAGLKELQWILYTQKSFFPGS